MNMEFTLNDLQRQRVEDHLALVCTRKAVSRFAARRFHTGRKWEHFLLTPRS